MTRNSVLGGWSPLGSKVDHQSEEGRLGSQEGVAGRLVSNIPSPDAVLLGFECQCDKVVSLAFDGRGCGRKYAVDATEGSIFEAEWVAI